MKDIFRPNCSAIEKLIDNFGVFNSLKAQDFPQRVLAVETQNIFSIFFWIKVLAHGRSCHRNPAGVISQRREM